MNKTLATLPLAAWLLLAGCATPPAATGHDEPMTAKERLDAAFKTCEEAPHTYFALCDAQGAADKVRMAALEDMNSSAIVPKAIHDKYLKTVADEDKAFVAMKGALNDWSKAIERLKAAAEDCGKTEGGTADAIVAAAMRAVESQENEYRKNVAKYEEGRQAWEKMQNPPKP